MSLRRFTPLLVLVGLAGTLSGSAGGAFAPDRPTLWTDVQRWSASTSATFNFTGTASDFIYDGAGHHEPGTRPQSAAQPAHGCVHMLIPDVINLADRVPLPRARSRSPTETHSQRGEGERPSPDAPRSRACITTSRTAAGRVHALVVSVRSGLETGPPARYHPPPRVRSSGRFAW